MKAATSIASKLVKLGSARAATKALGGTTSAETNMVFRYN